MTLPRVYLVTARAAGQDLAALVRRAVGGLPPGSVAVQLRQKDLAARELLRLARDLQAVCGPAGQPLLVNDRLDVAAAAGAAGAHLPSAAIPSFDARRFLGLEALIGVSCHSTEDVVRAKAGGADFATFGPVFETPSKLEYGPPVGLARLAEATRLGLPIYGLGGVDEDNAGEVIAAGAHGVAAIRAWAAAPDAAAAVRALLLAVAQP